MAKLNLRPSFPTLNHHLTEGTQRPTNNRPPNPNRTRTAATGTPKTRCTPNLPLIRSNPTRSDPIRSDPIRNA
ncbi:hypothetical protein PGTUg99_030852 [Puccinia graminis f. sp. tritici]|uniref:Uncharacterized protein n=1 Tax=Puccinia graminis f. sp. tritici TaxID=56615 RepID=A0A5B0R800_PUCGR|nr:hypothetical protein PGTUg99_030852 [Puccinia graminis f. sp. tritici]